MFYTIEEAVSALKAGTVTSHDLVKESLDTFENDRTSKIPLNAFIEMYDDALSRADDADKEIAQARSENSLDQLFAQKPLLGLPFANKDNISVRGKRLTCASKILAGYVAPYSNRY